jgi:hypothetical protein
MRQGARVDSSDGHEEMKSLVELANESGSDKGTQHAEAHAYALLYDLLFAPLRFSPVRVAEFGLQVGGPELQGSLDRRTTDVPSVRMWQQYFPRAEILGFDICDFSHFESDRFTFHRVDCADRPSLHALAAKVGPLDIVLDDASHASYHQQLAFLEFVPALRPGGIYVIEDAHWQPPAIEAAMPKCALTRALFGNIRADHPGALSDAIKAMSDEIASVQLVSAAALQGWRHTSTIVDHEKAAVPSNDS